MGAAPEARTTSGRSVGNYLLSKTIGEGTFGKVKLGVHLLTGERVAVKVLEKDRITDKGDVKRVTREIQILKHIQHPHVVNLLEVIEKPRHIYLVTEFVPGGELFEFIVAHGRLQETQACRIFRQVLVAVDACHALGVAHRDLKPENVLIDEDCNIKLIDFGLSNTFDGPSALLRTACGSPCYAAPEMIAGRRYLGAVADLWSLGVCLFAMLCGYLPFEDPDTPSLYKKILAGSYSVADHVSADARDLIAGLLTTDPAQRFAIPDIYNHPWFLRRCAEPIVPPLSQHPEMIPALTKTLIDPLVLQQLEALGMSKDYCVQCLQERKRNHTTAAYFLLRQRHMRNTPGGAQSTAAAVAAAHHAALASVTAKGDAGAAAPHPPAAAPDAQQPTAAAAADGQAAAGGAMPTTTSRPTRPSTSHASHAHPHPPAASQQPQLIPRPPTGVPGAGPRRNRYKATGGPGAVPGGVPGGGRPTTASGSARAGGLGGGVTSVTSSGGGAVTDPARAARHSEGGPKAGSYRETEIFPYGRPMQPPGAHGPRSARPSSQGGGGGDRGRGNGSAGLEVAAAAYAVGGFVGDTARGAVPGGRGAPRPPTAPARDDFASGRPTSAYGATHSTHAAPRRPMTGNLAPGSARRGDAGAALVGGGFQSGRSRTPGRGDRGESGRAHGGGGAGGVSTMSQPTGLAPRELMANAMKLVQAQKSMAVTLQSPFIARCEKHGLDFLMEVAATDATQSFFVLRLQLHRGDASLFRELAARIIPNLSI